MARPPAPDPIKALLRAWLARKGPVFKVAAKFGGLMVAYYIFTLFPFFDRTLNGMVIYTARSASCLLNLMGERNSLIEGTIASGDFSITVLKACTCAEFVWFYCAALIAFPSRWPRKIPGILIGAVVILALNVIRITTLFLVGVHFRSAFDAFHEQVWSILLVVATICLTVAWIGWARRDDDLNSNAA